MPSPSTHIQSPQRLEADQSTETEAEAIVVGVAWGRYGPFIAALVVVVLEDAIDLSYIHSRDYQTQIENVYLQALALTLQRFAFDVFLLAVQ